MKSNVHHLTTAVSNIKREADERDRIRRTREFREAERALGYVAVCLIGTAAPVRRQTGNAMIWPVGLRTAPEPARAPQRDASSHWEGSKAAPFIILLEHVWTVSEAHAARLKAALYAQIIGGDPDMRALNGGWVDRMDWREAWKGLLSEAVSDLRAGGETIEVFSDDIWFQRIKRHAERRARGGR